MLNFEVGKSYRKTNALQQRVWKCVAIEGDIAILCDPTNPVCLQAINSYNTHFWQEYTVPKIHVAKVALFRFIGQEPTYWYDDSQKLSSCCYEQLTDWVEVSAEERQK